MAETIAAAAVTRQGKQWRLLSPTLGDAGSLRASRRSPAYSASGPLETLSRLLSQGEKKLLDVASAFALDPR